MTTSADARSVGSISPAEVLDVVHDAVGPTRAVMLYGSAARGSMTADSDIDVLVLVDNGPGISHTGPVSITAYLAPHLRVLAARGSLFVLHLQHDGVTLRDPDGMLKEILGSYEPPGDPDWLRTQVAVAAHGLLAATEDEARGHGQAIAAMAFYLLRTAVYDECARRGEPEFDIGRALSRVGAADISALLARRRRGYNASILAELLPALRRFVLPNPAPSSESLAGAMVTASTHWPYASDLLAAVLTDGEVPYTALTLPPW